MPIYTFYCCREDGVAPAFEAADLPDQDRAMAHAEHLLDRHLSASHVEIQLGGEVVATCTRQVVAAE